MKQPSREDIAWQRVARLLPQVQIDADRLRAMTTAELVELSKVTEALGQELEALADASRKAAKR